MRRRLCALALSALAGPTMAKMAMPRYGAGPPPVSGAVLAALSDGALPQARQPGVAEGLQALRSNDFARAEQIFSDLVKSAPTATNLAYLAIAESSTGRLDESLKHFQEASKLGNDSPDLHYYYGLAYLQRHEYDPGIHQLRLALAKDPRLEGARMALGAALLNAGRAREAIPYLEQARAGSAHNAEVWANLVRAYFEAGERRQALDAADQAIDAVPNEPRLVSTLAFLCLHHQEAQKARVLLESASELAPQDNDLKILLAEASIKAGEPQEALAVLKDVPAAAGAPGELAFLRGTAYMLGGNPGESRQYLAAAMAEQPANPDYLFAYAGLQGSELLYSEALATLEKARQLAPASEAILYQIAVTEALLGRYPDATRTCRQGLEHSRAPDEFYFLLGVIALEERAFQDAQVALRKAVALESGVAAYHSALGVALYENRNLKESLRELDEALSLDPQQASAYLWRSRAYAQESESEKSKADVATYEALTSSHDSTGSPAGAGQDGTAALRDRASQKALEKNTDPESASFLDQLWLTRLREGFGQVNAEH